MTVEEIIRKSFHMRDDATILIVENENDFCAAEIVQDIRHRISIFQRMRQKPFQIISACAMDDSLYIIITWEKSQLALIPEYTPELPCTIAQDNPSYTSAVLT